MECVIVEMPEFSSLKWECLDCHRHISDSETVAYHLINRILYGWCEACFKGRSVNGAKDPVSTVAHRQDRPY